MKRPFDVRTLVLAAAAFAAPLAWAHPGHETADAAMGFAHPLAGLDHLFAMLALLAILAIGAWAVQQAGRRPGGRRSHASEGRARPDAGRVPGERK